MFSHIYSIAHEYIFYLHSAAVHLHLCAVIANCNARTKPSRIIIKRHITHAYSMYICKSGSAPWWGTRKHTRTHTHCGGRWIIICECISIWLWISMWLRGWLFFCGCLGFSFATYIRVLLHMRCTATSNLNACLAQSLKRMCICVCAHIWSVCRGILVSMNWLYKIYLVHAARQPIGPKQHYLCRSHQFRQLIAPAIMNIKHSRWCCLFIRLDASSGDFLADICWLCRKCTTSIEFNRIYYIYVYIIHELPRIGAYRAPVFTLCR